MGLIKGKKGITIIELMVVLVIVGILSGLAINRYRLAVIKSKISEAVITVKHLQELEEAYYVQHGLLPHQDGTMLILTSRDTSTRARGSRSRWFRNLNERSQTRLQEMGAEPLPPNSRFWYYFRWWGGSLNATKIVYAYPKTTRTIFGFTEEECDESLENVTIAIDNDGSVYVWGVKGMEYWH